MANISSSASNTILNGTGSADTITSIGRNVQIYAGGGNDEIVYTGEVSTGEIIQHNVTISGGDGDDSVHVYGAKGSNSISGDNGNDIILVDGAVGTTITGGNGNDVLIGSNILYSAIYGGNDDDSILVIGYGNTVDGGAGSDTINSIPESIASESGDYQGNVFVFNARDYRVDEGATEFITGANKNDTLIIVDGTYTTSESDGNFHVFIGSILSRNSIMLMETSSDNAPVIISSLSAVSSNPTAGDDHITNGNSSVTIDALAGNDTVENYGGSVWINGSNGDDSIYSGSGNHLTIDGGSGNDTIVGLFNDSFILGGAGDDKISMSGNVDLAVINGGTGNDTVYFDGTDGYNVFQYVAADGDDVIYGFTGNDALNIINGTYSTVKSGADVIVRVGNGSITLKYAANIKINIDGTPNAALKTINGSSSGEILYNEENNVFINALGGNDTILSDGSYVSISGGDGMDMISSGGFYNTIHGGADVDTVLAINLAYSSIDGGAGDDSIMGVRVIYDAISGGEGNDSVIGSMILNSSVNGDAGEDILVFMGTGNTVIGGTGNDFIANYVQEYNSQRGSDLPEYSGTVYIYRKGDGNDAIVGFDSKDTLQIINSTYSTVVSGSNVIVNLEDGGSIELAEAAGTALNIRNTYEDGGSGNNVIVVEKDLASVYATDGDDEIDILGHPVTVDAGAGNDTIMIFAESTTRTSINGGAGNDVFSCCSYYFEDATIVGGTGNDTIYNNSSFSMSVFQYGENDGNDVIYGLNSYETLHITSGSITGSVISGDDVILNIGSGSILLKDAAESSIWLKFGNEAANLVELVDESKIKGTSGNDYIFKEGNGLFIDAMDGDDNIYIFGNDITVSAGAGNDTITTIVQSMRSSVNGGEGNDVFTCAENAEGSTIVGGKGNDTIYNDVVPIHVQYGENDGNDVIDGLTGGDTIQITSGSITDSVISGEDVILNVGSGSILLKNAVGSSFWLQIGSGAANKVRLVDQRLYSEGTSGADSINVEQDDATVNALAGNDTINASGKNISIEAGGGADKISLGSEASGVTISGGAGTDTIYSNGNGNTILFSSVDGADIVYGFSDSDSLQITSGALRTSVQSGSNSVFYVGNGTSRAVTLKSVTLAELEVEDNVIKITDNLQPVSLTAAANEYQNESANATIYALAGGDTITNSGKRVYLDAGIGDDKVTNTGSEFTFIGGMGNDTVITDGDTAFIDAGAGSDRISLGANAEHVTIKAGAGSDSISSNGKSNLFLYENGDGKDTIMGFLRGDSISVSGGTISAPTVSSSNVIFTVGTGKIILRDLEDETFIVENNVITMSENPTVVKGTESADSLTNTLSSMKIKALAGNDTVTNSGNQALIFGGKGNDSIINSGAEVTINGDAGADMISLSADAENVTIAGGAGADTIYSNGNGNVIQYATGDGKDVIFGFDGDDSIQITSGTIRTSVKSGTNRIFYIGTGTPNSITIRDAADKNFVVNDGVISLYHADDNTNSPRNSNGSAAVPWFAEDDDNFISGSANLSDITAENYSVTNIETDSGENLTQGDKTLLTFAEK